MAASNFLGVWRPGSGDQWWVSGVSEADFGALDDQHFARGLRLANLSIHDGAFTAVWQPGAGTQWVRWGLSADAFAAQDRDFFSAGLRLVDLDLDGDRFAGVWAPGEGDQWVRWGLDADAFTAVDREYLDGGLRLVCLRQAGGLFAGVWRPGRGAQWWAYGLSYQEMLAKDREYVAQGLRLHDAEVHDGRFVALWRPGEGAQWWAYGDDLEKVIARDTQHFDAGLRLTKLFPYATSCNPDCFNQVLPTMGAYNYAITATDLHCEGERGRCPKAPFGAVVEYHWPCLTDSGSQRVVRLSAVDLSEPPIFTLPFSESTINQTQGWRYGNGQWHYALDFSTGDGSSFPVRAAADGTLIHLGWDDWSGNTAVISHDAGGRTDAYRTIYMHLRNGPLADATNSWARTVPLLSAPELGQFTTFLTNTGCPQTGQRNPDPTYWGTDDDRLDFGLIGAQVSRGQIIGQAGLTGAGGCGCLSTSWMAGGGPNTHLHIFFARRDPTDGRWYVIDPYGIYAQQACYPPYGTDITAYCPRYPSAWIGNKASLPVRGLRVRKAPSDRIDPGRRRIQMEEGGIER